MDFGVLGGTQDDAAEEYKRYRTDNTEEDAMYLMKANAPVNTEAHANFLTLLNSGKLKFLIDERTAKAKLLNTKNGLKMTPEQRAEYLKPFTLTSILKEEMLEYLTFYKVIYKRISLNCEKPLKLLNTNLI